MFNIKTNSAFNPVVGIGHNGIDVRVIATLLLALILLLSLSVQADGLFDFQMKLAKGGNAEAQYKVGEMYESGFGVKKNRAEAEKWITKAASKGHETAGFKLLYWDVEKKGLKGDNKAKVDELVKKADAGNPQAQYFVGKMHANGVGFKKNSDKAINWLNKAAFVGVLEAEQELITVREDKQRHELARSRAEEKKRAQLEAKKRAQLEAKKAKEKQAKLEQQRKSKAQQEAEARAKAEANELKKKADQAAIAKAKKEEEARKAKLLAQKEAAAREEARQREAKKQALLKQKAEQESKRKAQFESDPCSGKSARFLSTCK